MNNEQTKTNWNIPKVVTVVTGLGWITVQAIVPLFWLVERGFEPKPRQFGWQMYTNMAGGDRFQAIYQDERVQEIDPDDFAHNIRPGLDYGENFLDYLCQQFPQAIATQRIMLAETKPQVYPCKN